MIVLELCVWEGDEEDEERRKKRIFRWCVDCVMIEVDGAILTGRVCL